MSGTVEGFCNSEIIPLIKDSNANQLLRFRAFWVLESFLAFLKPEKEREIVEYICSNILQPNST